jgi:subtilisin family serine protease
VNEAIVERVIVALKERDPSLKVTPNHVIFSCQNWLFEPDGDPRKPAAGQEAEADGGGRGIVVAVVDTGLPQDYGQNSLLQPVNADPSEFETFSYEAPPQTVLQRSQGHGAFVAGVVRQFAQHATVWSYRALDNVGTGDEWALGHQLADALSVGPRIINLSLGTVTRGNQGLLGLSALGALARQNNGSEPIVIAAAGNLDLSRPFWPAADTWAISVGAAKKVGRRWEKAHFSDFGKWVDVCADGVDVLSSYVKQPYQPSGAGAARIDFDGWAIWNGTSFATPLVSGVVADLLAQPGNGGLGHFEVLAQLRQRMVIPRIGSLVL